MIKGIYLLLAAAFLFALSTVFIKLAVAAPYFVPPSVTTFTRFLVGFIAFSLPFVMKERSLKPNNIPAVSMRAVTNTFAVILFFTAIKYTTVTKANILNLTYPAFVFLFAPFITKEKQQSRHFIYLFLTLLGAAFIVIGGGNIGGFSGINTGDLLALGSGLLAGFAISGLREARKYDTTSIILFYQMAFGSIVTFILMLGSFAMPKGMAAVYVITGAALSNTGQYCLTEGYRYISAALGSIVLESGILFAAILGITVFNDPLTMFIVTGGLLILVSIAGISGVSGSVKTPKKSV